MCNHLRNGLIDLLVRVFIDVNEQLNNVVPIFI